MEAIINQLSCQEPDEAAAPPQWEWHQDCLVITILLASTYSQKSLKKLLKRTGYLDQVQDMRPQFLLQALHEACHLHPEARDAVAKDLGAKFQTTVRKTKKLTAPEIHRQADQSPWLIPLIWACYKHDCLTVRKAGLQLAHLAVLQGMKHLRGQSQVVLEQERGDRLAKQNSDLRRALTEIEKEKRELKSRLAARPPAQPQAGATMASPYKKKAKQLQRQLREQTQLVKNLQDQLAVWRSLAFCGNQDKQLESGPKPVKLPHSATPPKEYCRQKDKNCACSQAGDCPLRGRKVAVIGGLDRLEKNYCQLVEELGGKCLYHTGQMRSGARKLRQIVNKSDMVVYLTPINSHAAMNVVKKQCKRSQTPLCPLNGTSVTALESILRNAGGYF
jgi:hypothetical protein